MKTGIIGLPQVGKSSLFRILTKAHVAASANPRDAHIGVAKVPDDRLDRLAAQYNPKKLTHASVEYVDLGAIGQEALKESAYLGHLRQVDAIIHVVRAFEDDSIPHVGTIDPLRDIKNVEFDLMVSDLGQIEKRMERVEKDLKKMRSADIEKEFELLKRAKAHLETERPLRELEMTPEDKKRFRGFMFLSEKPILYVLNISESTELGERPRKRSAEVQIGRSCVQAKFWRHCHLRKSRSRAFRNVRCRRCRISLQLRTDGKRPHAPDPKKLRAAWPDFLFHHRGRRMPRLDDSRQHPRSTGRRGDSLGS
jgi:hypothetical protein